MSLLTFNREHVTCLKKTFEEKNEKVFQRIHRDSNLQRNDMMDARPFREKDIYTYQPII